MGTPLLTFIIPLVSKATCGDWDEVMARFKGTIASIANQACPDYHVVIVCNEPPDIALDRDRTTVLNVDLKLKNPRAFSLDKERKMHAGLFHVRSARSEYVMFLDADDLVSRRLVQHVAEHRECDGFVADRGYVYYAGQGWVFPVERFYLRCGSCYVFRYRESDTPDTPEFKCLKHWMVVAHNKTVISAFEQHGYRHTFFPFPAVVYVRGHKDSIRARKRAVERFAPLRQGFLAAKTIAKRALHGQAIDEEMRREFGGLS